MLRSVWSRATQIQILRRSTSVAKKFWVNCLDRTIEDNTYTFVAKEQFLADAEDALDRMVSEALFDWVLEEGCQITIDLNYLAFSSFTKTL